MPTCCGTSFCNSQDDGVLSGKNNPIEENFQKPLTVIFQNQLKNKSIHGSRCAVDFSKNVLSYTQLDDFSTALAHQIEDRVGMDFKILNPDSDVLIATCLPASEKSISVIFGILKTGAGFLPIDPEYPEQLLLDIVNEFRPILLITDENGQIYNKYEVHKFSEICKVITVEELWLEMEIPSSEKERKESIVSRPLDCFESSQKNPPGKRVAVVFHTRGIHNNPVGVRLSHLSIINRVLFDWNQLHLKLTESCSLTMAVSSPDSVCQIFATLLRGCTLHVFRRQDVRDMENFVRAVATQNINRLTIANHHFSGFLHAIEAGGRIEMAQSLSNLKLLISRGGFIRYVDVQLFFDIFKHVTLFNLNGPAETCGEIIYEKFNSMKEFKMNRVLGRLTLGRVIDNVKIYILGEQLGIISDGNQGEICASGFALALGYVNQTKMENLKTVFVKNPQMNRKGHETLFRSGEFGRILISTDGKRHLYIEGRDDDIIKRRGHDFSTEDVRMLLSELEFAKDAYVFVYNKARFTQEMIGFLVPKDDLKPADIPDIGEVEFILRNKIPEWAMPDEIMIVDSLPTHFYGECCPYCLMQQFYEQREPKFQEWTLLGYPPEELEAVVTLMKGMFKFSLIPIETSIANLNRSFFELGGSSLDAVTLLVYLNKRGYPVTLRDFLTTHKLRDFANLMETRQLSHQPSVSTSTFSIKPNFHIMVELSDEYEVEILKKKNQRAVVELIATAYCEKGELQSYNMVSFEDFTSFLMSVWPVYEEEGGSLVVIRKSDKVLVGAVLCEDFFTIIDVTKANGALFHVLEFFHEIKGNMLQFVPHRKSETLEISWMGTLSSLTPQENMKLITLLHTELIKLAKRNDYSGIFNPTSNKLSRTLCIEIFGYNLLEDFPANQYKELDGSRPFHLAGDLVIVGGLLLKVRDPLPPSETTLLTMIDPKNYFEKLSKKGLSGMISFHKIPNQ